MELKDTTLTSARSNAGDGRIHSMELKVDVGGRAWRVSIVANPFNGIERVICLKLGRDVAASLLESIQWN